VKEFGISPKTMVSGPQSEAPICQFFSMGSLYENKEGGWSFTPRTMRFIRFQRWTDILKVPQGSGK
jgi:hypothetical protein